jgi:tetratricopeptide (TPR) repeat protein
MLSAFEEALQEYRHARAADGNLVEAHLGVGRAQYALGRYDQARSTFDRARRMDDENPESHWALALALLALEDEAARGVAGDDKEQRRLLAVTKQQLTRVTELAPQFLSAWLSLADLAIKRGDERGGFAALDKAVAANASSAELQLEYGARLQDRGRQQDALAKFDRAITLSGRDELGIRARAATFRAGILLELRETPEAVGTLDAVLADVPEQLPDDLAATIAVVRYFAGIARVRLKRFEEALAQFEAAQQDSSMALFALHLRILVLRSLGRYGESWRLLPDARAAGEAMLKRRPDTADVQFARSFGEVLRLLGERERAIAVYRNTIDRHRDEPYLRYQLIATCLELSERSEERGGKYVGPWTPVDTAREDEYARARYRAQARDEFGRAEPLYKARVDEKPSATNLVALGALYMLMRDDDAGRLRMLEAVREGRRTGVAGDAQELAHAHLAAYHLRRREYGRAAQEFEAAWNCDRDELSHRIGLAEAQLRLGRLDEAHSLYQSVIEIAPGNVEARIGRAEVLIAQAEADEPALYELTITDYKEAMRLSEGVATLLPEKREGSIALPPRTLARLHYQIGYAHTKLFDADVARKFIGRPRQGNLILATRAFRNAVEIDRSHPQAAAALDRVRRERRQQRSRRTETWIPRALGLLCLAVFVLINLAFFVRPLRDDLPADFKNDLTPTSYAMLVFGILVLTVAVVSLPQLLKLKIAGVSLEKAPIEQAAPLQLDIRSDPFASYELLPPPAQLDTELSDRADEGKAPSEPESPSDEAQQAGSAPAVDAQAGLKAGEEQKRKTGQDGAAPAAIGDGPPPEPGDEPA